MSNVNAPPESGAIAVSVETASKISNIGRTKLYEMIGSGILPARKCGRRTLILVADLETSLKHLPIIGGRAA
jgi:excisionase family DNA binding protein